MQEKCHTAVWPGLTKCSAVQCIIFVFISFVVGNHGQKYPSSASGANGHVRPATFGQLIVDVAKGRGGEGFLETKGYPAPMTMQPPTPTSITHRTSGCLALVEISQTQALGIRMVVPHARHPILSRVHECRVRLVVSHARHPILKNTGRSVSALAGM